MDEIKHGGEEAHRIARMATLVEGANYAAAANTAHHLEEGMLTDIRANLEFCLDIVVNEQRQRGYGRVGT